MKGKTWKLLGDNIEDLMILRLYLYDLRVGKESLKDTKNTNDRGKDW